MTTDFGALRKFDYEPEQVLGEGAFGQVLLATHKVTTNDYACKKLKKEQALLFMLQPALK